MRIGFSKDIHRLVSGRNLIIGGVIIPFDLGEDAHSDGDVLYHAIAEAILGALALGDLGKHFPDNIEETKNMNSAIIVETVFKMMDLKGYEIENIDCFISLEKPKLVSYILEMRNNVSRLLNTSLDNVSIKAGTNEKVGPVGEGKAIEAYVSVLLKEKKK